MNVRELMIKDVIQVTQDTPLKEVLGLFVRHKIGGAPVVNERGQLTGMVSDGDVLRFIKPISPKYVNLFSYYVELDRVQAEELIPAQLERPVRDCMKKSNLVTLQESDGFEELVSILSRHHFKKVPVLDPDRRVVGVISRGDVLRYIVSKWIQP
ncbi:CBS domain-containing protein [Cohnella caldifontis]|uniref:CBS domain-containing protein n=1 Tax=Cohnella caldifontis TaxID=3027471 RepID=UPI0023EC66ED|nr:CBS domain-containing protein [Cohnella sp. YIM B05605]